MTANEQIREILKSMSATKAATLIGQVTDYDQVAARVTVDLGNGLQIDDVRLKSALDGSAGFYAVPAIGATALILRILGTDEFHMLTCSHIEGLVIETSDAALHITETAVTFNKGQKNSFMIDINQLVIQLNTIQSDLNSLKSAFLSWVTVPQDGGAALKAITATWAGDTLTPTTANDIKDEKIKH